MEESTMLFENSFKFSLLNLGILHSIECLHVVEDIRM